jgi:hypothetical protein
MAPKKKNNQDSPANIPGPRTLRSSSSAVKVAPTKATGSSSRRTPAQVKADKEAKQAQQKAEQGQKHAALVALSQKEVELIQRERELSANANHPPMPGTQAKHQRKRLRSPSPEFDVRSEGEDIEAEEGTRGWALYPFNV